MTEKLLNRRLERLRKLIVAFPAGSLVWHRAKGLRGVVVGHELNGAGGVVVRVDFGGSGFSSEMPLCLSKRPVSDGTAGDEWKDGEGVGV